MNEGEIRQAALMYALIADMEAIKARVEGMKAYNNSGFDNSYAEETFENYTCELEQIAKRLREEI